MPTLKIFLGADHGGFALKEEIKNWLTEQKYAIEDCGAFSLNPNDDYTDFAFPVAEKVAQEKNFDARGIVICRAGGGVLIAANKVKGIRATEAQDITMARHVRADNDSNILAIPADFLNHEQAKEIVNVFLTTPFSGAERHVRRLQKISQYELSHP